MKITQTRRGQVRGLAGVLGCLALVACGPLVPNAGPNPVQRSLGWFATLEANDLRRQCRVGADRLRLIYNGSYDVQLRWYELAPDGTLSVLVRGVPNVAVVDLRDPLGPWRGTEQRRALGASDRMRLLDAVAAAGPQAAAPGTRLDSHNGYWIAALCRSGAFHYAAFDLSVRGAAQPAFVPVVLALDPSGVPLAPPPEGRYSAPRDADRAAPGFVVTVERDGLAPMDSPFAPAGL